MGIDEVVGEFRRHVQAQAGPSPFRQQFDLLYNGTIGGVRADLVNAIVDAVYKLGLMQRYSPEKGNRVPREYVASAAGSEIGTMYSDAAAEFISFSTGDSPPPQKAAFDFAMIPFEGLLRAVMRTDTYAAPTDASLSTASHRLFRIAQSAVDKYTATMQAAYAGTPATAAARSTIPFIVDVRDSLRNS